MNEFQKNHLTIDDAFELIFKLIQIYFILLPSPDIYQTREQHLILFTLFLQVLELFRFKSYNADQIKMCLNPKL